MTDAEISVIGHLGLTPQSLHRMGGYRVQGKTLSAAEQLLQDAVALDQLPAQRSRWCSKVFRARSRRASPAELTIPTIGIGAGPECDGQIPVLHDLLNLSFAPTAKFVRRYGDAASLITSAVQQFKADVETRQLSVRRGVIPPAERDQGGAGSDPATERNEGVQRGSSWHVPEIPSAARDPYFLSELFGEMRHFFEGS